jgi:hypothetical protein
MLINDIPEDEQGPRPVAWQMTAKSHAKLMRMMGRPWILKAPEKDKPLIKHLIIEW